MNFAKNPDLKQIADKVASESEKAYEGIIFIETNVARINARYLVENFDSLPVGEITKLLQELGKNGRNLSRCQKFARAAFNKPLRAANNGSPDGTSPKAL